MNWKLGLIILLHFNLSAQKHDYNWVLGTWSGNPLEADYGATVIDFNENPQKIYKRNLFDDKYNLGTSVVTYSDVVGKLQFFTNGGYILDTTFTLMQNGGDLELGLTGYDGNVSNQSIVGMQMPADTSKIILIYTDTQVDTCPYPFSRGLFYAVIDMKKNNGKGAVVEKNKLAYDKRMFASQLAAVRHANGRDWWLTKNDYYNNKMYVFLLSPNGLKLHSEQYLDCPPHNPGLGQAAFSTNGEWYAAVHGLYDYLNYIVISRFNRCSGRFSQCKLIKFGNKDSFGVGVEFSPNSRFLYVSSTDKIFQYDLQAMDIAKSIDTVAIYDGNIDPLPNNFFLMKLGPDGKIYISGRNGTKYMHVIENPDTKGKACNVIQRAVKLPVFYNLTFQNHPNYRLGPLKGSPCDTITVATKELSPDDYGVKIFPNPATEQIQIDINLPNYDPDTKTEVLLVDVSGEIVQRYIMPDFAYLATLDISKLSSGVYGVQLRQRNKVLAAEKLVVVH